MIEGGRSVLALKAQADGRLTVCACMLSAGCGLAVGRSMVCSECRPQSLIAGQVEGMWRQAEGWWIGGQLQQCCGQCSTRGGALRQAEG